jgi:ribosomal protein S18 acetylase RimI-like enzyme
VAFVESEARRRDLNGVYLEVAVWNEHARRLYERLGYTQEGERFQNSWNFHREDGRVEERVEEMVRLVKRF